MARIVLRNVSARYELLTVREYNLKRLLVDVLGRKHAQLQIIDALRAVNLNLEEGARLGLVGANGAGKSTLLSVMAGLLPPTSGTVRVDGRVLALLGGASAGLDQEATGLDNIVSLGVQLGEDPSAMRGRIDDVVEFSGLQDRVRHPVYSYSAGMQARLRFSILTSLRPDVLLIDEGIGTADAGFNARAHDRLAQFMAGAGVVVFATHSEPLIRSECKQALWLDRGTVRHFADVDSVLREYNASLGGAGVVSP